VHPACTDDERGARRKGKNDGGEVCIVLLARGIDGVRVLLFVGNEVMVGCGYGGVCGAFEAVCGFATDVVLAEV
jgi:hypothetical protein